VPVSDTLKQVSGILIDRTLDRSHLWQAQTPQMFRLGLLRDCLQRARIEGKTVTDEASALETYGYQPLMVLGRSDNIKITRPEDLGIAAMFMQQQKI
jgi:2-C-methyl-D-erythritol 4-phosphate cytidylyltransferase